jgi:hypothetical protein
MREYRRRKANGEIVTHEATVYATPKTLVPAPTGPGPVESAVKAEIADLIATGARPGLVQVIVALAELLDDPTAKAQKPAAAGKLAELLRELRKGSGVGESRLSLVRSMTSGDIGDSIA